MQKVGKHTVGPCRHDDVGMIAKLVWHKGSEFRNEFQQLLKRDCWKEIVDAPARASWPTKVKDGVETAIAMLLLKGAAEFDYRVIRVLLQDPFRWLVLAEMPHDTACERRAEEAARILETPDTDLEINTLKLKICWVHELKACVADEGRLDLYLHRFVWSICKKFKGDAQNIEGLNNVLKGMIRTAPNISQHLASARLAIKFMLGTLGMSGKQRLVWSRVKEMVNAVLDEAVIYMDEAVTIFDQEGRWETRPGAVPPSTVPADLADVGDRPCNPATHPALHLRWAGHVNLEFHWTCIYKREQGELLKSVFAFCPAAAGQSRIPTKGDIVWCAATRLRFLSNMIRCRIIADDIEGYLVEVCKPVHCMVSVELLRQFHGPVCMRGMHVRVFELQLDGWMLTQYTACGRVRSMMERFTIDLDVGDDGSDDNRPAHGGDDDDGGDDNDAPEPPRTRRRKDRKDAGAASADAAAAPGAPAAPATPGAPPAASAPPSAPSPPSSPPSPPPSVSVKSKAKSVKAAKDDPVLIKLQMDLDCVDESDEEGDLLLGGKALPQPGLNQATFKRLHRMAHGDIRSFDERMVGALQAPAMPAIPPPPELAELIGLNQEGAIDLDTDPIEAALNLMADPPPETIVHPSSPSPPPSLACPMLLEGPLAAALRDWISLYQSSADAVALRHRALGLPLGGGSLENMSIVMYKDAAQGDVRVDFVQWTSVDKLIGRIVQVDMLERLITMAPASGQNPLHTWKPDEITVVCNDVGDRGALPIIIS